MDIEKFFDTVDHKWLIEAIHQRIADRNFLRLIVRFLKAGVMEEGKYVETDKGTPQGGIISPVLANIYLHYILDKWFEEKVKPQLKGYAQMIRYADDCAPQAHKGKSFKGLKLCKSCTRDGGMPSKAGLQGQALNNHELRW